MKKTHPSVYLLLCLSIFMLCVPVMPHHHHNDGLVCMKSDIPPTCCANHPQTACHTPEGESTDHCCCNTGCITTHFYQEVLRADNGWLHPHTPLLQLFFPQPLLETLTHSLADTQKPLYNYRESLHSTFQARATALRAPPL